MRYWPTLIMVLILVGLSLYLYTVEFPNKETQERQDTADKKVLLFDQETLSGLTIKTNQHELVFARNPQQGWLLTAPLTTEADQREVQSLIRALATGTVTRVVEDHPANLTPFGLDNPVTKVTVLAGVARETFSIGDSGPLSSTLYVLRESDHKVLLTTLAPKDFVNKTLMTFRRKDILHMSQGEVERIRITYPIEAEADQTEVRTLLFRLEDLKALGIIDPGPERDALAKKLTLPKVKVAIHTADGDQTVRLYKPDEDGGMAIAETRPDGPLYRLNATAIKDLTKELYTFQDKRLLGIDYTDIAILSVKTPTEQYVLINQQNEWVLEDRPTENLDQQATDLFVSRVANVPAEDRVSKQAGPLAPYGLVTPAAEFVATGRDGKSRGKLSIGSHADGLAYAMGQRISGIFQIRADLLTQIPKKSELLGAKTEKTR